MILPYITEVREKMSTQDQVALVIFDVFKGHLCDSVQSLLESNKILQVHIPSNCTDLLQPMDLSENKPFKGGPHFFSGFFFFLHIIVAISLNKNFSKFYDKFMHTF